MKNLTLCDYDDRDMKRAVACLVVPWLRVASAFLPAVAGVAQDPEASPTSARTSRRVVAADSRQTSATETRAVSRPRLDAAALHLAYAGPSKAWPRPIVDPGVVFVELGLVPKPPHPAEDPWSKEKESLGRALFFDGRLSGPGQMACASCHDAELGFADGRSTSFGHGFTPLPRNAPSILNAAFGSSFFWDGRAKSLQDQALAVFENAGEMHTSGAEVVAKLKSSAGYRKMFEAAYGAGEPSLDRTLSALATFERTIASDGSAPFDKFLKGDAQAIDDAAVRGLHLFRTTARCANCHHGPLLTDGLFHDLGLSYYGRKFEDLGRYRVTKDPADVGRFKTPSLRNVERTAPYMHLGLFDLDGVLNMYSAGMATLKRPESRKDDPLFPTKSPLLQRLDLSAEEKADLRAFLSSLTERRRRLRPPDLPPMGDLR